VLNNRSGVVSYLINKVVKTTQYDKVTLVMYIINIIPTSVTDTLRIIAGQCFNILKILRHFIRQNHIVDILQCQNIIFQYFCNKLISILKLSYKLYFMVIFYLPISHDARTLSVREQYLFITGISSRQCMKYNFDIARHC